MKQGFSGYYEATQFDFRRSPRRVLLDTERRNKLATSRITIPRSSISVAGNVFLYSEIYTSPIFVRDENQTRAAENTLADSIL